MWLPFQTPLQGEHSLRQVLHNRDGGVPIKLFIKTNGGIVLAWAVLGRRYPPESPWAHLTEENPGL